MSFNAETGRFAVHATGVPRGELLDQLAKVAQIEVRPQPPRGEPLTISADGLDLDELLARIMPADARYIARRGQLELASKVPASGAQGRRRGYRGTGPKRQGQRRRGDAYGIGNAQGGGRQQACRGALSTRRPRHQGSPPLPWWPAKRTNPRSRSLPAFRGRSLRVTLLFELGKAPKVLSAQNIEGGPPDERFVRGPFLFLLMGADGRILQYGSFEDPLEEHSYLEDGTHTQGRAKSGITGISLDNSKLQAAALQIIDAREVTLPRELNEEVLRGLMQRTKPLAIIPATQLLRAAQQESAQ